MVRLASVLATCALVVGCGSRTGFFDDEPQAPAVSPPTDAASTPDTATTPDAGARDAAVLIPPLPVEPGTIGVVASANAEYFANCKDRLVEVLGPSVPIVEASLSEPFRPYALLVLVSGWAEADYSAVHPAAERFTDYVEGGGSFLIFQPNPSNFPGEELRVDLLPAWFEVQNTYFDSSMSIVMSHPIVDGLTPQDLPFAADRITAVSPEWRVLVRGDQSRDGSLAVLELGSGRVVLDTDNPTNTGRVPGPMQSDRSMRQMLAWLLRM
jgi:hypothetical protein